MVTIFKLKRRNKNGPFQFSFLLLVWDFAVTWAQFCAFSCFSLSPFTLSIAKKALNFVLLIKSMYSRARKPIEFETFYIIWIGRAGEKKWDKRIVRVTRVFESTFYGMCRSSDDGLCEESLRAMNGFQAFQIIHNYLLLLLFLTLYACFSLSFGSVTIS